MICDFCAAENPQFYYECLPFVLEMNGIPVAISDEKWAACSDCRTLIDESRRIELVDRCAEAAIDPCVRAMVSIYQSKFFRYKQSEAKEISL